MFDMSDCRNRCTYAAILYTKQEATSGTGWLLLMFEVQIYNGMED